MAVAIITGSSGLVGSESARFFHAQGYEVIGIDNNLRAYFFGEESSIDWNTKQLQKELKNFTHADVDVRNREQIFDIFKRYGKNIGTVIHAAGQPSHDWAAKEPFTDFSVNAYGTHIMLEATRIYASDATFIFTSTNKVYGDTPNQLPLIERELRWEVDPGHRYAQHGVDESMSIDQSKHSLFGASKLAADILVQEYGRYFGLKTGVFRGGCLTGPAHRGAELHGFLSYLVKCAFSSKPYTVHGYKGKQVRDNIHSYDLSNAFWHFHQSPKPGAVYNIGGGRHSNCSLREAVGLIEAKSGKRVQLEVTNQNRSGDHIWWISDVRKFQSDFPNWSYRFNLNQIFDELIEANQQR